MSVKTPRYQALDTSWIKRSSTVILWRELGSVLGDLDSDEVVYLGRGGRRRMARWARLIAAELHMRGDQPSLF